MTKTVWVFPGQGSQVKDMGVDLFSLPEAKEKLEFAQQILGWSVPEICKSEEKLSHTPYTQPALYTVESLLVDLMRSRGAKPQLVAGHSLGEYVALYAAGVFNFQAGLALVKQRSELMNKADEGQMAALMGFDREELEEKIAQNKYKDVVIANDNSPAQVVISGTKAAVEEIIANIKVKRAVKLKVSKAFHSPFMESASAEFEKVLDSVPFTDAEIAVISNVDPTPATAAEILKERLKRQIVGSVRWREISLQLPEEGVERVVEIGPGKVLTGLIKRTCSGLTLQNVSSAADLPN
ncbi:MAG: ACP S-malonyltransferase [Oscillatoria sp. SIO1A7]|nr:ACP S-malonyltransferase [Oscillatoria sp. SIO1A7]